MIDSHDALRAFLIAPSALRTLLGGDFVFAPELPATFTGLTMPDKAISFRVTGGLTGKYLKTHSARVTFRCWGTTSDEARDVYAALYGRLNGQQGLVVGSVAIHGADEEIPVLFLHQVERHYRQGDETLHILNGAELAIWAGQSVALVAPSGAGKSTLLHLAGLLVDHVQPHQWGFYPVPTPLYGALTALIVGYLVLSVVLMAWAYRHPASARRGPRRGRLPACT